MEQDELKVFEQIKNLLVVLLVKIGASSEEIGEALGVGARRVQQLYSMTKIKRIKSL